MVAQKVTPTAAECSNCGGTDLRWYVGKRVSDDLVPDGRLRMSEVSVIAYLACEECSETLAVIEEGEINEMLNSSKRGQH